MKFESQVDILQQEIVRLRDRREERCREIQEKQRAILELEVRVATIDEEIRGYELAIEVLQG